MYKINQTHDSINIDINTKNIECRCVVRYSALGSDHIDIIDLPEFINKRSIIIPNLYPNNEYNIDCKLYDIYNDQVYGFNKNIKTFSDILIYAESINVTSNSATIKFSTDIKCNVFVDGYIATVNTGDCSHVIILDNLIPNKNYNIKIMINSDFKYMEHEVWFKTDEDISNIDNNLVENILNNNIIDFLNHINTKITDKNIIFNLLLLRINSLDDNNYIRNVIVYLNKINRKDIWQKYEV